MLTPRLRVWCAMHAEHMCLLVKTAGITHAEMFFLLNPDEKVVLENK